MEDSPTSVTRRAVFRSAGAVGLTGLTIHPDGAAARSPGLPVTTLPVPANPADIAYLFFSEEEAAFVEAAVDRLIPHDDEGPGALELGAARYIDRQLAGPFGHADRMYMAGPFRAGTPQQGYQSSLRPNDLYRLAIAELDAHCQASLGNSFADLPAEKRDAVLADLEAGRVALPSADGAGFFAMLWANTVEGYFADPLYGGNKDMAAWRMIGFPGTRADYRDLLGRSEAFDLPPLDLAQAPPGTARR